MTDSMTAISALKRMKNIFIKIRNTGRNIVLTLISLPYWINRKVIRMELLAWALCSKAHRYQAGNLFFKKKGTLDTHCYGETPLITLERIAKHAGINNQSRVLDMGSGAGRAAVWLAIKKGCTVLGAEQNPRLVHLATRLATGCKLKEQVTFIEADMITLPPQDVDIIYIYHSALDDRSIEAMGRQLGYYGPEVKIVTVSYALEEILPGYFETEYQFDGWFPWGVTWVYIQRPTGKLLTELAQTSSSELIK